MYGHETPEVVQVHREPMYASQLQVFPASGVEEPEPWLWKSWPRQQQQQKLLSRPAKANRAPQQMRKETHSRYKINSNKQARRRKQTEITTKPHNDDKWRKRGRREGFQLPREQW